MGPVNEHQDKHGGQEKCARLLLHASGRVSGLFEKEDGAKLGVVLESSGVCLSYSSGDGSINRELTCFATNAIRPAVLNLVAFRNRVRDRPFVHAALHCADLVLDRRVRSIRWPTQCNKVTVEDNGARVLKSIDGCATLCVAPDRRTFRVDTIAPLSSSCSDFRYKSIVQTFFCDAAPACYRRVLAVAQGLACEDVLLSYMSQDVPSPGICEPDWGEASVVSDILLTLCSLGPSSVPRMDPIEYEWRPLGSFRLCLSRRVVQISVAADGSLLELQQNGYFSHELRDYATDGGIVSRTYAPSGVPRAIRCGGGSSYELASLADHARRLLFEQGMQQEKEGWAPDERETGLLQLKLNRGLQVQEEQHAAGLGRFTCFADQSVKAIFEDRTIVFATPGVEQCEVICADGSTIRVNSSSPCHVKYYVEHVQAFYAWCMAPLKNRSVRFENPDATRAERIQQILQVSRRQLLTNRCALDHISCTLQVL